MKFHYFLLVILIFTACATMVVVDYDQDTDFTVYQTYDYFPELGSGLNQLDDERIMTAMDSLLQARGFVKMANPQFYINFFANEVISESNSSIGVGIGGGGGSVGVGVSGSFPVGGRQISQQLTVDFINVEKDELFWQAINTGEFKENSSPQQKESYYFKIIDKILKEYPPEK